MAEKEAKQKVRSLIKNQDVERQKKYRALEMFTDDVPTYDLTRYVNRGKQQFKVAATATVEIGKILIVIKEMEPHDVYVKALLHIGVNNRQTAWNYMRVAHRYCGIDPGLVDDLGVAKLYTMLKAPQEELEKFEQDGSFLDMDKEKLVTISTRELERIVKETLDKVKEDNKDLDARVTVLTNDNHQKDREIERLKKEAIAAYTGKKAEKPLPEWWNEFTGFLNACVAFQGAIQKSPPDLQDKETYKSSYFVLKRIEHEVTRVTKYLRKFDDPDFDPVAFREATEEKLASLPIDDNGEIDVTKLGRAD